MAEKQKKLESIEGLEKKIQETERKIDVLEKDRVEVSKVKENPTRFLHLSGRENCYRIRAGNLRIVYWLQGTTIWFLIAKKRDSVYEEYFKRLFNLKQKMK